MHLPLWLAAVFISSSSIQAASKRFKITGTGKVVLRHPGKQHINEKKSSKRLSQLGKPHLVSARLSCSNLCIERAFNAPNTSNSQLVICRLATQSCLESKGIYHTGRSLSLEINLDTDKAHEDKAAAVSCMRGMSPHRSSSL